MKTKITIDLPEDVRNDLADIIDNDLRWIFADALYEFIAHRGHGNAQKYMNERYPLGPDCAYSAGPARETKLRQVERRCNLAHALHTFERVHIERVP